MLKTDFIKKNLKITKINCINSRLLYFSNRKMKLYRHILIKVLLPVIRAALAAVISIVIISTNLDAWTSNIGETLQNPKSKTCKTEYSLLKTPQRSIQWNQLRSPRARDLSNLHSLELSRKFLLPKLVTHHICRSLNSLKHQRQRILRNPRGQFRQEHHLPRRWCFSLYIQFKHKIRAPSSWARRRPIQKVSLFQSW